MKQNIFKSLTVSSGSALIYLPVHSYFLPILHLEITRKTHNLRTLNELYILTHDLFLHNFLIYHLISDIFISYMKIKQKKMQIKLPSLMTYNQSLVKVEHPIQNYLWRKLTSHFVTSWLHCTLSLWELLIVQDPTVISKRVSSLSSFSRASASWLGH